MLNVFINVIAFIAACLMIFKALFIIILSVKYCIYYIYHLSSPSENIQVIYKTPLVPLLHTTITFIFLFLSLAPRTPLKFFYIPEVIMLVIYFLAIYRTYQYKQIEYNKIVDANLDFSKLCFAPICLFITVYGLLFSVTGKHINIDEWPKFFYNLDNSYWEFASKLINLVKNNICNLLARVGFAILWCYVYGFILSIPKQLVAYIVLQIMSYCNQRPNSYAKIIKALKELRLKR